MDLRRDSQEDTSESPGFSRGEEVKEASRVAVSDPSPGSSSPPDTVHRPRNTTSRNPFDTCDVGGPQSLVFELRRDPRTDQRRGSSTVERLERAEVSLVERGTSPPGRQAQKGERSLRGSDRHSPCAPT